MNNLFKKAIAVALVATVSCAVQAMNIAEVKPKQLEQVTLHEKLVTLLNFFEALPTEQATSEIQSSTPEDKMTLERMKMVAVTLFFGTLYRDKSTLTPQDEAIVQKIIIAMDKSDLSNPTSKL